MNYLYKDLNLSMIAHPSTGDVVARYDLEAIKSSIKNILNTNKGEKLFNPEFGANLRGLLFELLTPSTGLLIKRRITEEIQRWEPRVRIENVTVKQATDMGEVVITLVFSLKQQPEVTSTVTIKIERTR